MQEHSNGAIAAPAAPRLTAGEVGQRIGKAVRTVYEIWDKGAMWSDGIRRPDGKWAKRWTFAVCVDAYLQAQAQLRQGPAPEQLDLAHEAHEAHERSAAAGAEAPPAVAPVESDRTSLVVARSILGEDAPAEAVEGFAQEIDDYRRNIALLHPQTRLVLVREYYGRVKRSARHLTQLGPGLVAAVASVLVLAGVGMAGA